MAGKFQLEAMGGSSHRRIGLLGGSFNPPHAGHVHLSKQVLRALGLDAVVWLVSPQNPLKSKIGTPPQAARLAMCRQLLRHEPRISATGIETQLGTRYTIDTLRALRTRWPNAQFVWMMGSDNLVQFHRWRSWRAIAACVPMVVVERGNQPWRALKSQAGQALASHRTPRAAQLKSTCPPAWHWLAMRRHSASSTAIRART